MAEMVASIAAENKTKGFDHGNKEENHPQNGFADRC